MDHEVTKTTKVTKAFSGQIFVSCVIHFSFVMKASTTDSKLIQMTGGTDPRLVSPVAADETMKRVTGQDAGAARGRHLDGGHPRIGREPDDYVPQMMTSTSKSQSLISEIALLMVMFIFNLLRFDVSAAGIRGNSDAMALCGQEALKRA